MAASKGFAATNYFAQRWAAFTLTELLAVIATLAILAVVLLPAIAGTKVNTQAFQCMNNEREIMLGWQMFAADNNERLPPNDYPYNTCYWTYANKSQLKNWVVGTMAQVIDANLAIGRKELVDPNSLLSPYVTNASVYHCPADNYVDPRSHTIHPRSYSMNSAVGTIYWTYFQSGQPPIGSPVQGAWLSGSSYNPSQTTWRTYGKMSSFNHPGPERTFVLMDENPYAINDGTVAIPAAAASGNTYLIDFPSGSHGATGVISFADGHGMIHRWLDRRTYTPESLIQLGMGGTGSTHPLPDDPDCFYLASITSALR